MVHAVEIYNADPNTVTPGTGTITATSGTVTADASIVAALTDAGMPTLPKMKSTEYKAWVITFTNTGWTITTDTDGTNGTKLSTALGR